MQNTSQTEKLAALISYVSAPAFAIFALAWTLAA